MEKVIIPARHVITSAASRKAWWHRTDVTFDGSRIRRREPTQALPIRTSSSLSPSRTCSFSSSFSSSSSSMDPSQKKDALVAHEQHAEAERQLRRNPHPDFKKTEASRPAWRTDGKFAYTQTPNPDWKYGEGASDASSGEGKKHVEIDPYEEGRPGPSNYKLLISGIVPRPIGFCSTVSGDGKTSNLAPFSYFQVINHDPPLFIFGFAGGFERAKDSLRNLVDTGECCVNIISEHYIEAANATSINAPKDVSEWPLSGLHPVACRQIKAPRVGEAIFSIEAKLVMTKEFESRATPGRKTGVLAVVEGVRFWVREDAINEARDYIDPAVLRPMSRLGGISYGRVTEGIELLRPDWSTAAKNEDLGPLTKAWHDDQQK